MGCWRINHNKTKLISLNPDNKSSASTEILNHSFNLEEQFWKLERPEVSQLHGRRLSLLTVQTLQQRLMPTDVLKLQRHIVHLDMATTTTKKNPSWFQTALATRTILLQFPTVIEKLRRCSRNHFLIRPLVTRQKNMARTPSVSKWPLSSQQL